MWPLIAVAVAATKPAAKQRLPLTQNPMVLLSSILLREGNISPAMKG